CDLVRARRLRGLSPPALAGLRPHPPQAEGADRLQRHHRAAHGDPATRGPGDLPRAGGVAGPASVHPRGPAPGAVANGDPVRLAEPPLFERREGQVDWDNRVVTLVPGKARGRLLGGNLCLMSHLVGTPYLPDLRGSILFLEDV